MCHFNTTKTVLVISTLCSAWKRRVSRKKKQIFQTYSHQVNYQSRETFRPVTTVQKTFCFQGSSDFEIPPASSHNYSDLWEVAERDLPEDELTSENVISVYEYCNCYSDNLDIDAISDCNEVTVDCDGDWDTCTCNTCWTTYCAYRICNGDWDNCTCDTCWITY